MDRCVPRKKEMSGGTNPQGKCRQQLKLIYRKQKRPGTLWLAQENDDARMEQRASVPVPRSVGLDGRGRPSLHCDSPSLELSNCTAIAYVVVKFQFRMRFISLLLVTSAVTIAAQEKPHQVVPIVRVHGQATVS